MSIPGGYISPDHPVIQALRAELDQQKATLAEQRKDLDDLADSVSQALRMFGSTSAAALRSLDIDLQSVRNRLAAIEAPGQGQQTEQTGEEET